MSIWLSLLTAIVLAFAFWAYTPDRSRRDLETAYGVTPADYVEAAGIRLHLRDTGPKDAPAVVLLHGFGSSLDTWNAWAHALSADFRVVRYDLPGFALTGPDPTGNYSETRGIQVLAAMLDALGVAHATIIGNSIGGKLAWEFAAAYPARIDKLVLISPDGFASPGFDYGKPAVVPAWLGLMRFVLPKPLVRMSLAPAYGEPGSLRPEIVTRYWDLMRAPGARAAMVARLKQTILTDPEPNLRRIEAPTLLLWGDRDGMIPVANAADYQKDLKQCQLVVLRGLGHVPQEEAPAVSLLPVLAFLRGAQGLSSTPGSSP
jgi:pimeloyl-ACP methyl ester carboxylesterase